MLELLDRDVRVRRRLLLRLDNLVQLAQLGVELRQRRALFLKRRSASPCSACWMSFKYFVPGS